MRQILRQVDARDQAAEPGLILHRANINCGAIGEVIKDLFSPSSPGMMLAHEFADGVDGSLVVRVASIVVEAFGQIRTVRRYLAERVGRQDRLVFAAPRQYAEQARPRAASPSKYRITIGLKPPVRRVLSKSGGVATK